MAETPLTVVAPFAGYARGDRITDDELITAIWGDERRQHVVRAAATPEPAIQEAEPETRAEPVVTEEKPA